jgi:hypothetical protein
MAKEFKSNIKKPTDAEVQAMGKGRPFQTCKQCGLAVVMDKVLCPECTRLEEVGFGPTPRSPHARPGDVETPAQTYDAFNHKGYSDTIPSGKFDPKKQRM